MAQPNEKELSFIKQLREKVSDLKLSEDENSDMNLVRWLRARDLDLIKADDMIRKSVVWREENDIENILDWKLQGELLKQFPFEIIGHDNSETESPICVNTYGRWDMRSFLNNYGKEGYVKYNDFLIEKVANLMRQKRKQGIPVYQFITIFDLEGFGWKHMTTPGAVDAILSTVRRFEGNHPEVLKKVYVINAPRIFSILFGLIKPLLTARTLEKVEIHGSNAAKWKAILLKQIPADQLPPRYGGTNNKFNNLFNTNEIEHGSNGSEIIEDENHLIPITVGSGEMLEVAYDIKHPNTKLSWIYKTDDFDICFSLNFDNSELISKERVDSHLQEQRGSIICEKAGRYTFIFDNTYSVMRPKNIYYYVNITSNDPSEEENTYL